MAKPRPTEAEFDELKRKRAEAVRAVDAEIARVAAHEAALDAICESPEFYYPGNTASDLRSRLEYLHAWRQSPSRDWQEFAKRAADALASEIAKTKVALAAAEKREAEAAEATRLAREAAEQARREREALIAAHARREAARVAAAAAAEIARQKAAEDAAAAERKRIADAQAKDAAEAAAREANQRHRARIHADAREALQGEGLSFEAATAAVTAIARGAVPHIRVTY